ncbi:HAD family hydrolase [Clostridium taeniosporum]|uniref:HAD family phosphatase n=1 Tax=Clostridium taeniosporum TaxID=394958 RepID=A0A1D7XNC6_9CLOT|nr:HAD family phosphatase [Clostridium taeniosporum]AOR24690.1 HAD family phosphatase [Clostridium taeniosporum]
MLSNINAAIFDLDGTLVDSMMIWQQIDIDYLKKNGYELPKDLKNDIIHLSFRQTAEYFKNRFDLEDSIDTILKHWHDMAFEYYSNKVELKEGVKEFLDSLKSKNIKIGLATSNSNELLEVCLKANNIYDYFDSITTTGETKKGKDSPDVYLLAAKRLDTTPDKCVVFEDILPAIKSAKSAGMKVIAVKDEFSIDSKDAIVHVADKYISSFFELI